MSDENTNAILREISQFRKDNKDDHARIEAHAEHTNGTVAELVAWKIQVRTVLWIFGVLIGSVVLPVAINILNTIINKHL